MSQRNGSQVGSVTVPDEASLWRTYVECRDPGVRVELIARYMQTAQRIAASMYARRPFSELEFADYLQYARIGLIESIDRFEPGRGASFETYAGHRIKGAILNGIETNSELTAQCAHRRDMINERVASVHTKNRRTAGEDPFAWLAQTAIDLAFGYALEDAGIHGDEASHEANDVYNILELKQIRDRLAIIVEALPEREKVIIKGHYFDHLDFAVLASQLGLTKGRVSQLHARGLTMVREAYRALTGFDVSV
jgi:RNA polymerase sigma factor for flagellar operon FliA